MDPLLSFGRGGSDLDFTQTDASRHSVRMNRHDQPVPWQVSTGTSQRSPLQIAPCIHSPTCPCLKSNGKYSASTAGTCAQASERTAEGTVNPFVPMLMDQETATATQPRFYHEGDLHGRTASVKTGSSSITSRDRPRKRNRQKKTPKYIIISSNGRTNNDHQIAYGSSLNVIPGNVPMCHQATVSGGYCPHCQGQAAGRRSSTQHYSGGNRSVRCCDPVAVDSACSAAGNLVILPVHVASQLGKLLWSGLLQTMDTVGLVCNNGLRASSNFVVNATEWCLFQVENISASCTKKVKDCVPQPRTRPQRAYYSSKGSYYAACNSPCSAHNNMGTVQCNHHCQYCGHSMMRQPVRMEHYY